jgi:uncharacterized membrane protein YjgN (DUF898 family)
MLFSNIYFSYLALIVTTRALIVTILYVFKVLKNKKINILNPWISMIFNKKIMSNLIYSTSSSSKKLNKLRLYFIKYQKLGWL